MKNMFKYSGYIALLCLQGGMLVAQPTGNPVDNIPDPPQQPGLPYSVDYPGLQNMTGNGKFNYIRQQIPDVPVQTWPSGNFKYRQSAIYFDGLGRPLQSVSKKSHDDGFDIIQHHVYDASGNESHQYLPFAVPTYYSDGKIEMSADTRLRQFYDQLVPDEQPYNKTDFENSPLGRIIQQYASGRSWVGSGRGVKMEYRTNAAWLNYGPGAPLGGYTVSGGYPRWTIAAASGSIPVCVGDYAPNELRLNFSKDEDGNSVMEYKDKNGQLVIRTNALTDKSFALSLPSDYAYTCYVYDDIGRLRCVIPPKASNPISSASSNGFTYTFGIDQAKLDNLCYQYFYDGRERIIEKKIPGKAVEYFVYDKRDRMILSQDGNLRSSGQARWHFTLYDALNRPTITGILYSSESRTTLQGQLDDGNPSQPTDRLLYYTNNYNLYNTYPNSLLNCDLIGYNYYDDYSQLSGFSFDAEQFLDEYNNNAPFVSATQTHLVAPVKSDQTKGILTGKKVRVSDPVNGWSGSWLTTVNYYDEKGRMIQSQSRNLNNGLEISSNMYYFQGMLWKNIFRHQNPNAVAIPGANDGPLTSIKLNQTFELNLANGGGNTQISSVTQRINDGIHYQLATYDYDHLGRSTTKLFPVGVVLNEYNLRGFLNHIKFENFNTAQVAPHKFEENLYYDKGFGSKLYNGNIAGITWSGSDDVRHSYGYSYDRLNRLNHAEFRHYSPFSDSWVKTGLDYTASNITYDLNGNIQSMDQRGPGLSSPIPMDQLVYTYAPNSNELVRVVDGVAPGSTVNLPDFKDNPANTQYDEYDYDFNGNLIRDNNKDISSITYNYMNKPEKITVQNKGYITYLYDAEGNRLQKTVTNTSVSPNTTEVYQYMGNFVYRDNELQYILNEEGRARPIATSFTSDQTKFVYDYFIKDHLGNVRSNVTAEPITPQYLAMHEIGSANVEQLVFDNIPAVRDGKPGSTNMNDGMAAHLVAADPAKRVGTAIMLRTMPGDRFVLSADAYYEGVNNSDEEVSGEDMISSLMNALMGGNTYVGTPVNELPQNAEIIQAALGNASLPSNLENVAITNEDPAAPKAYLNYLFFNEGMELEQQLSGKIQVQAVGGAWTAIGGGAQVCNCLIGVGGGTTGYLLVYIDNQSIGKDVWFDNVFIEHYTSAVLEENHYYPFGLTLSTDAGTGVKPNPYKFGTKELEKSFGLELYDFGARPYDPQIGRWLSVDPLAEQMRRWSPYNYAFNNPVRFIDPDGMSPKEYYDQSGGKLGEDEDGNDGNVQIITDEKEIALILNNEKNKKKTPSAEVQSGVETTKGIVNESLNVLERTIKNGGKREESSLVMANGSIIRGTPGPEVVYGSGINAGATFPDPPAGQTVRTGIHSHTTAVELVNGKVYNGSALNPSTRDDGTFPSFSSNIIVGRLGYASGKEEVNILTGQIEVKKVIPGNGVVFYNRNGERKATLTDKAARKISK